MVAAAWPVEDEAAAELLGHFHQGLAAGRTTEEALREAQMAFALAHRGEETRSWAAFQLFRSGKSAFPSVSNG
jgi:CHAT domain-containing protein